MDKMKIKKESLRRMTLLHCGATRNRTGDTRPIYRQCQSFALPTELWHVYKKSHSEEWLFYIVVPPGIEPWTQGQFINNVSPLLYQLSYGTYIKKSHSEEWLFYIVVPPGIEPGTQGFSVLCSTIWAMAPTALICECKGTHYFWICQIIRLLFA